MSSDTVVLQLATGLIVVLLPLVVAFVMGVTAYRALRSKVAAWPVPFLGKSLPFFRRQQPVRYWLIVSLNAITGVVFLLLPFGYYFYGHQ